VVDGNQFDGTGVGNTTAGIVIGSNSNGKVGVNGYGIASRAINTNLSIGGANNSYIRDFIQTGVVNITTNSASGSFWTGVANVVLPKPTCLQITPGDITAYSGLGGVFGVNIYGVNNSGNSTVSFDVQVISSATGTVVPIQWQVRGIV
jgi:hypothetical protein